MLKVGLIGCGFMGTMHANCYKNIEGVEIAALADIRREKAEALAEGTNAVIFGDGYDLIANAENDVVNELGSLGNRGLLRLAASNEACDECAYKQKER